VRGSIDSGELSVAGAAAAVELACIAGGRRALAPDRLARERGFPARLLRPPADSEAAPVSARSRDQAP
jgi:hypothetical protein